MKLTKAQLYALLISILFIGIFHNYCSLLAINIFLFFDNLFQFGPDGSPLILWCFFGLMVGLIYGAIVAWKKYTLDFKLTLIPFGLLLLIGGLLFFLNQPFKSGASTGTPLVAIATPGVDLKTDTVRSNVPIKKTKSNYTITPSNTNKVADIKPNNESKASVSEVKSYTGNVGRLNATFNIMWMSDGTVQGTYYCDSRSYKIYALRGRKLSNGQLEMNEYTDNTISAHCSLSFSDNCFVGRMNNTDGRSFDIKMCEPVSKSESANQQASVGEAPIVEQSKIFTFVEQNPQFPGGDAELMKFLQKNIQYPQMERDNDIQGKVLLRFVVMEDGSVSDITVVRAVSPGLDKEAIRVVNLLPKFTPGRNAGKPVRVYFNLPVVFRLS